MFLKDGRIDILAKENKKKVAIELKAANYSTQQVCAQLLNYINFVEPSRGKVYFIAPKVKMGIYTTLKKYHEKKILELYEVSLNGNGYIFKRVYRKDLDDSRRIPDLEGNYKGKNISYKSIRKK